MYSIISLCKGFVNNKIKSDVINYLYLAVMEELVKSFKFIEYLLFMHESCVYAFIFVSSNLWEKN